MADNLIYRTATEDDAISLSGRLREADQRELELVTSMSFQEALVVSVEAAEVCQCAVENGLVIAVWGVTRSDHGGLVWMLGSNEMLKYQRLLLKDTRPWVNEMVKQYGFLYNYVHKDNKKSIKWLVALGFNVELKELEYGVAKAPFYFFNMKQQGEQQCVHH